MRLRPWPISTTALTSRPIRRSTPHLTRIGGKFLEFYKLSGLMARKQGKRQIYMPSGRASADRRIFGSWIYQRDSVIFVGEINPYYWIEGRQLRCEGVDHWASHIRTKTWDQNTGWSKSEIDRDFRQAANHLLSKK